MNKNTKDSLFSTKMTDVSPQSSFNGKIQLFHNYCTSEHFDSRSITAENIEFKAFIKSFKKNTDETIVDIQINLEANPVDRNDFPSTGWFAFSHIDSFVFPHGKTDTNVPIEIRQYQYLFHEWNNEINNSLILKNSIASSDLTDPSSGFIVDNICCVTIVIRHTVAFRLIPSVTSRLEPLQPRRHAEDFFRLLYHNENYSDGKIICNGHVIPIHTILLIARNRLIFDKMFSSPEFKETKTVDITSHKFSNAAVLSVIRWLYRQELIISPKLSPRIYKVAHHWNILPILHVCRCFIDENNIWPFLGLARIYQDNDMTASCLSAFDRLKSLPFNSLTFSRAKIEDIEKVVRLKGHLIDRCVVISALVGWARLQSGKKDPQSEDIIGLLKPALVHLEIDQLSSDERATLTEGKSISPNLLEQLSTVLP